ncbi:type I-E CRISPR-associated protein Cas7/Cse4/CasC [Fundidesulfovibrio putealis]|uniref:type I-E CRISPR-associated protein Cas7/Cse4/CasC n=1 Tax=Fundidesulfovibrio putealis TaxID=270496 RepID=UPI00040F5CFD|nr:type I-E CRISPR-associated protein Cas7/Cse4/CasC [Fundidesulfovibrio putealis]
MSLPTFLQLSTLTSYPSVLLNRDDSGLAKRMPFGGAVRTRISSQCLKRHWRLAQDPHSLTKAGEDLSLAVRSREVISRRLAAPLMAEGFPMDVVNAVLASFQADLFGKKSGSGEEEESAKTKGGKKADADPNKRGEVVVLGEAELAFLLSLARDVCTQAKGDPKKAKADKLLKSRMKEFVQQGAGVDAAMFGRFLSGEPTARVTSAVHVAHALTVHAEAAETDYFTAVDDLTREEHSGSGHLGATELTSGLFYTYVVVDVPGLVENLGGGPREKWLSADRTVAARLARHLIHLVCTVTPGAKLGSTAPYARAGFVLAELGESQPRTLANAFLDPLRLDQEDILLRASQALSTHLTSLDAMYGCKESRLVASLDSAMTAPAASRMSLPELAQAVERAILTAGQS